MFLFITQAQTFYSKSMRNNHHGNFKAHQTTLFKLEHCMTIRLPISLGAKISILKIKSIDLKKHSSADIFNFNVDCFFKVIQVYTKQQSFNSVLAKIIENHLEH